MTTDMPAARPVATEAGYRAVIRLLRSPSESNPVAKADRILRAVGMLTPPPVPSTDMCRWLAADEDGQWWQCTHDDEDHDGKHVAEYGFDFGNDDPEVIAPPERIRFVWANPKLSDGTPVPQGRPLGAVVHRQDYRGPMGHGMDTLWFTACGALPLRTRPACGSARREQPDPSWTLCEACFTAS